MEGWRGEGSGSELMGRVVCVQDVGGMWAAEPTLWGALFIPETATHSHVGPRLVYTVGHHHAICFAPFGFEDMGQEFSGTQSYLFGVDPADPRLQRPQDVDEYRWYNRTIASSTPMLADATAQIGCRRSLPRCRIRI